MPETTVDHMTGNVFHTAVVPVYGKPARRMGLLVTGGSDFHQENDRHGRIGATADSWARAEEDMEALMCALNGYVQREKQPGQFRQER